MCGIWSLIFCCILEESCSELLIWAIALKNGGGEGWVVAEFEEKLHSGTSESGAYWYSVKYGFGEIGFTVRAYR